VAAGRRLRRGADLPLPERYGKAEMLPQPTFEPAQQATASGSILFNRLHGESRGQAEYAHSQNGYGCSLVTQ
jgi:hypothetical protein